MIHPRELEILNILWNSDKALTSADIVEEGNRLSQSTVQAVLRKLLKDELVLVEGVTHSGNVLSRTYRPAEASRDIITQQFVDNYSGISSIVSKANIFAAMLRMETDQKKRAEELDSLKKMISDYENQIDE
jgi:predicted transcriptional regulator